MTTSSSKTFSSSLGFIAAATGSAVGLGNIWRFPYEVGQHGGAAFLLLYLAFTLVLVLPMLLVETAFGRHRQGGTYNAFIPTPRWHWLGWVAAVGTFIIVSFYNVVTGWIVGYLDVLWRGNLLQAPNMELFFKHFVAQGPTQLGYTAIATCLVGGIVYAGIHKGLETCAKVLMPLFLLMLFILIGYAVQLPGAGEGLKFYLVPNFRALTLRSVFTALSLSFMTLGVGAGILTTYGAYMPRHTHLVRSTSIVALLAVAVSFLAGLLIFPLIFHYQIPSTSGPGLVFISLPLVFQQMGSIWGWIAGSLFFLLLLFAAVTSAISLLEVGINHAIERWHISRAQASLWGMGLTLLLAIPSLLSFGGASMYTHCWPHLTSYASFFDLIALFTIDLRLPFVALALSLYLAGRWKPENFDRVLQSNGRLPQGVLRYLYFVTAYLAPTVVGLLLLTSLKAMLA